MKETQTYKPVTKFNPRRYKEEFLNQNPHFVDCSDKQEGGFGSWYTETEKKRKAALEKQKQATKKRKELLKGPQPHWDNWDYRDYRQALKEEEE